MADHQYIAFSATMCYLGCIWYNENFGNHRFNLHGNSTRLFGYQGFDVSEKQLSAKAYLELSILIANCRA